MSIRSTPAAAAPAAAAIADQAAGLRSLLKRRALRVLPVFGDHDPAAHGACSAQLALALARAGHKVVLLDASGTALDALGLRADADLLEMIEGRRDFAAVALRAAAGLRVISARAGLPMLIAANAAGSEFFGGFLNLAEPVEILLLNLPALATPEGRLWLPMARDACESLLVTMPGERALTAAYALIKQAATPASNDALAAPAFRILVNGAEGERAARAICRQLSDTARRFLGVAVGYAGNLPSNTRGRGHAGAGAPHAEAARAFARIAGEAPGWRLAQCMHDQSIATQTH